MEGQDTLSESPRLFEVRLRGLAPNQIGVGSIGNSASDGCLNPGSNTEEPFLGAVADDEVVIARINVANQKSCAVGIRSGHDQGRHTHDVGGESSRPGADPVALDRRVVERAADAVELVDLPVERVVWARGEVVLIQPGLYGRAELGYGGPEGGYLVAVENTPKTHNLVVCTLCSCYPWPVLGLPPVWYKSFAYRSRAVRDPRGVLQEFDVEIPPNVEVRVWDSSAEQRYIVIPMRPKGTERMSEEQLAELVTRDSMIGVAQVKAQA